MSTEQKQREAEDLKRSILRTVLARMNNGQTSIDIDDCYRLPGVTYAPHIMAKTRGGGRSNTMGARAAVRRLQREGLLSDEYRLTEAGWLAADSYTPLGHVMDPKPGQAVLTAADLRSRKQS